MTNTFVVLVLLAMILVFLILLVWRRRARLRSVVMQEAAKAAASAARADAYAADALKVENAIARAIAEQSVFEASFNVQGASYDRHLRRRAVTFRAQRHLERDLTVGEILIVKERVQ